MVWYESALLMIGGLLFLMFFGMPVAIAFLAINIVGVYIFMGGMIGIDQLVANASTSVTSFALVPVPLFLIMGELLFHTGLAIRVFDALDKCFGGIKGRLSYLTVGGGTIFATLSGSSMANTAMLGTTLMPDMIKRGYKPHMIMGPILATGGLAMIIPPSSLAVLLGSLARIDVGALLIAGLVPGLLLAALFIATIRIQIALDPDAAPGYAAERASLSEIMRAVLVDVMPMGIVVFAVVGLILLGWATPTESAAFGALSVVVLAACYRTLSWQAVVRSLTGTLKVSAMMLMIIVGSTTFSQILAFSGASSGLISFATSFELNAYVVLAVMFLVLLLLGMFMDQLSIMMLTLPIFMPLVGLYGFDQIWFGVVMLLALELSLATPPFGLLLFVMVGVSPRGTTIGQVARAALPYIACTLLLVVLLALFPQLALWLPGLIRS
ncbi:TRAP transporter large permease [Nitratireductor aquimarinus]|uniref:TRAP transporter large permease protein n=1 Tax=Nitratireductor aquimarinus TaxID=889300 RepID=A0ABU4AHS0_9HYPH|nr:MULTISPECIES: TRAP transporter large permease [Alphaproteobacteria]MBY6021822.1 TRAP transporter large permease [Nitratireductor sp. DP7N14-4]MBN7757035.1 TRAP transporter large permease [Nitratireductor aquimarinus]MBN7777427.1 TRAP transporter large permease [Nitratireductor pacificus]MBN7781098.1 TRAP transporter large permease [Nitratireductor pacificus]MBN7789904.1 TRAP transporter large permease [Nitratireductor aquimarinus]